MATDIAAKDTIIRRRVLLGTVSSYAGKALTLGVWFFLTPFILHRLGPVEYGLWVVVGQAVAYGALLDLGIAGAVTKFLAEYNARGELGRARSLIATSLCLYSALGLVAAALGAAFAPLFLAIFNVPAEERGTAIWLVLLMSLTIGIFIPSNTPWAVLAGLQRYDLINLISAIGTLVSAAATVAVLLLGGGALGMVVVNIPLTLLQSAASVWCINRVAPELRFGWRGAERSLARLVISFSMSLFVTDTARQMETKTDELVIGAFLPLGAIAPYSLARKLSELPGLLSNQFLEVLLPLASELHAENDEGRLRALYLTGTRLTLALGLPIAATLIVLARPILTVWVGPAYADAAHLVTILTLAGLIATSQWPATSIAQGMARHRLLAVMAASSALANLALSIGLVRGYGLSGVALGTLLPTTVVALGLVLPYGARTVGVGAGELLKRVLLPALAPAAPTVLVLFALRQALQPASLLSVALVTAAGLGTYAIGYLSVGASESERHAYRGFALGTLRFIEVRLRRS